MKPHFQNISSNEASRLINQALAELKRHGITQGEVEGKIDYHSLAKAKHFEKYKNRKSELIGGKKLQDVLEMICDAYGLTYDRENNSFYLSSEIPGSNQNQPDATYIFLYSSSTKPRINKGIVIFKGQNVDLYVVAPEDLNLKSHWSGKFSHSGLFLFLDLTNNKGGTVLKSLQTYYVGTPGLWQKYYSGTYSGIKADGDLIVGKCILEKVANQEEANSRLEEPVDKRLSALLKNSSIASDTKLIRSLDSLVGDPDSEFFTDKYDFRYLDTGKEIQEGTLDLSIEGEAKLTLKGEIYQGSYKITESRTLEIQLVEKSKSGRNTGASVYFLAQVRKRTLGPKLFSGICIARDTSLLPRAFPFLITSPEGIVSTEKGQKLVSKYFSYYQNGGAEFVGKRTSTLMEYFESEPD